MNPNNSGAVGYNPYRWCIVPECKNSSVKTPEKLWIRVPTNLDTRKTWLKLASRDPKTILISKSHVYFCEDHFNLENDMENYKQYKRLGSVKKIQMKPNCIPTRFDCQTSKLNEPRFDCQTSSQTSTTSKLNEPRFDCQTSSQTSTTSKFNEPLFGVSTVTSNSQSVVPLEQSKRYNLVLLMKTEDYCLHADVTETPPIPELFCICCLEREVPVISLLTCSHADFLNNLKMPEIKPQNQVICYQCHEKLKKIKLFELQVEESFKLLSDASTGIIPKASNQRRNLIRQVFNIDIPQTNFNNIENPQTNLEDASTDLNDIIKEEKVFFDDKEKSLPTKSLQTKNMKNIEEAIRIINSNQNSDCINFLSTSLQSLSHSLLSDIYNNFELGSQNDTNPTKIIIDVNTAPSTNNIPGANAPENVTNNIIENTDISKMISDHADVVENVAENELNEPETEEDESMDIVECNNLPMDETPIDRLAKELSLGSNIKQLTLTREQLMEEREKIATSQSYLRAPHRCESCLIGFQFQENLEDHVKRKHTSGKLQTIQCNVCLQHVDCGGRNMQTHMFWHFTRFECVACAEKFTSYDKAAVHYKKNHSTVRSSVIFKCRHCPYKTARRGYFTGHLNAYTKCKLCGVMLGCATGIKPKVHMRTCAKLKKMKLKTVSKKKKAKVKPKAEPILNECR